MIEPIFQFLDGARLAQGEVYAAFGFGPSERRFRVIAEETGWRLRAYEGAGSGPPLLIIASPIKRPYVWDLAPRVSAVSRCLEHGLRVCLLEWTAPRADAMGAGLEAYAGRAISQAIVAMSHAGGDRPFLAGHSLGGTLAAIHAALDPACAQGLILLSAPVCFAKGTSPFRDSLAALAWPGLSDSASVPGALLSSICAFAAPGTFVVSRLADAGLSLGRSEAFDIHARVERWTLDEAPLPARLVREILEQLYRQDRFCRGELRIGGRVARVCDLDMPILAVTNSTDQVAPRGSVRPFLESVAGKDVRLVDHPGEIGVALQHVSVLVGRDAHATVWPEILAWITSHAQAGPPDASGRNP